MERKYANNNMDPHETTDIPNCCIENIYDMWEIYKISDPSLERLIPIAIEHIKELSQCNSPKISSVKVMADLEFFIKQECIVYSSKLELLVSLYKEFIHHNIAIQEASIKTFRKLANLVFVLLNSSTIEPAQIGFCFETILFIHSLSQSVKILNSDKKLERKIKIMSLRVLEFLPSLAQIKNLSLEHLELIIKVLKTIKDVRGKLKLLAGGVFDSIQLRLQETFLNDNHRSIQQKAVEAFCEGFEDQLKMINLKLLLKFAYLYPDYLNYVLNKLINCTKINKVLTGGISVDKIKGMQFRAKMLSETKEITVFMRVHISDYTSKQTILSIKGTKKNSELNLFIENCILYLNYCTGNKTEEKWKEILHEPDCRSWISIALSYSINKTYPSDIFLRINQIDYRFSKNHLKKFFEISLIECLFDGHLEYLLAFSNIAVKKDLQIFISNYSILLEKLSEYPDYFKLILIFYPADYLLFSRNIFEPPEALAQPPALTLYTLFYSLGGVKSLLAILEKSSNINEFSLFFDLLTSLITSIKECSDYELFDSELFASISNMIEVKQFEPDYGFINSFHTFLVRLDNEKIYLSVFTEIIINSSIWKAIKDRRNLIMHLELFLHIPEKIYIEIGKSYNKVMLLCDYFLDQYEVSKLVYTYLFHFLKKIVSQLCDDINLLKGVINKLVRGIHSNESSQSCRDFFFEITNKWKSKKASEISGIKWKDLFRDLVEFFTSSLENKGQMALNLMIFMFKIFTDRVIIFVPDPTNQRVIDFIMDFSEQHEYLRTIQSGLSHTSRRLMDPEICDEIFNFSEHCKVRKVCDYGKGSCDMADIIFLSLFDNRTKPEFKNLVKWITNRCIMNKKTAMLISNKDNFPGWTFDFVKSHSFEEYTELWALVKYLFSQFNNFLNMNKLRLFLSKVIKIRSCRPALSFFLELLKAESTKDLLKIYPKYIIELLNITEDLIYKLTKDGHEEFKKIALWLFDLTSNIKYSLNFPKIIASQFEDLNKYSSKDANAIWFRDGGICRQLLKIAFVLMSDSYNKEIEDKVKEMFSGNRVLENKENEWNLLVDGKRIFFSEKRMEGLESTIFLEEKKKNTEEKNLKKLSFVLEKNAKKNWKDFLNIYVYTEWYSCANNYEVEHQKCSLSNLKDFLVSRSIINDLKRLFKNLESSGLFKSLSLNSRNSAITDFISKYYNYIDPNDLNKFFDFNYCNQLLNKSLKKLKKNPEEFLENSDKQLVSLFKLCTSIMMDILSLKLSMSMKINYTHAISELNISRRKTTSEESLSRFNEKSEILNIPDINPIKRSHKASRDIFAETAEDFNGKRYIKSRFDRIGRYSLLCKKLRVRRPVREKSSSIRINSIPFSVKSTNNTQSYSLETSAEWKDTLDQEEGPGVKEDPFGSKIKFECEMIKLTGVFYGEITLDKNQLKFLCKSTAKPESEFLYFHPDKKQPDKKQSDKKPLLQASSLAEYQVKQEFHKSWDAKDIKEIVAKRYIHVDAAIEVYLKNGKSLLFNFFKESARNRAWKILLFYKPTILNSTALQKSTKLWKCNKLSNFEYLLILNKLSGRSFNNISQYPIFPWVLKDYSSTHLNLELRETYRNFEFAIGAQNDEGREVSKRKYEMALYDETTPYHFGSHYSNGGIVLHYLVRIEPFTQLAKELQGGDFDVPDRLFYSLQTAWESCQSFYGDCKEMVPELFFLPEALINVNNEILKTRQNGVCVGNVELPPWAKNSVYKFISLHQKALESSYVSHFISDWIDLVFGYKQQGDEALKAFNLFHPVTYKNSFEEIMTESPANLHLSLVHQAVHFGQTPVKLFKSPHPRKEEQQKRVLLYDRLKNDVFKPRRIHSITEKFTVLFLSGFILLIKCEGADSVVRVLRFKINSEKVKETNLVEVELNGVKGSKNMINTAFRNEYILTANDAVYMNDLSGELLNIFKYHLEPVSCLFSSECIISGSQDSSLFVYQNPENTSIIRLLGHFSVVNCVTFSEDFLFIISGSLECVLIHDFLTGCLLRSLKTDAISVYINKIGCIVIETDTEFKIFSVNGETVRGSIYKNNEGECKRALVIDDYLIRLENNEIIRSEIYYDEEFKANIKISESVDMYYNTEKDLLFIIEGSDNYSLSVI